MSTKTANPTLETHEKFHKTIRNLFRISSSVKLKDKSSSVKESSGFNDDELLLPISVSYKILHLPFVVLLLLFFVLVLHDPLLHFHIHIFQVMMKPLKRRFKYHFFNNKVTGNASKPEWYFCQVYKKLFWLRGIFKLRFLN